jgi:predicted nucleotidyltransferase
MLIKLGLILRQDILLEFVLRGNFGPDSDVDVFVEFETGHVPVFFPFVRLGERTIVLI